MIFGPRDSLHAYAGACQASNICATDNQAGGPICSVVRNGTDGKLGCPKPRIRQFERHHSAESPRDAPEDCLVLWPTSTGMKSRESSIGCAMLAGHLHRFVA